SQLWWFSSSPFLAHVLQATMPQPRVGFRQQKFTRFPSCNQSLHLPASAGLFLLLCASGARCVSCFTLDQGRYLPSWRDHRAIGDGGGPPTIALLGVSPSTW